MFHSWTAAYLIYSNCNVWFYLSGKLLLFYLISNMEEDDDEEELCRQKLAGDGGTFGGCWTTCPLLWTSVWQHGRVPIQAVSWNISPTIKPTKEGNMFQIGWSLCESNGFLVTRALNGHLDIQKISRDGSRKLRPAASLHRAIIGTTSLPTMSPAERDLLSVRDAEE